ncbi:DUF6274 family protein [Streptomyces sp. NPDC020403]|uniref:DUF6274 family protein n=1 Tax=unclassified Streptomyces TaxID=2593676 RepID=UPI0033DA7C41
MSASTARHETRALLRAHLAAASDYRHLTRDCPVCHRLQALARDPLTPTQLPYVHSGPGGAPKPPPALRTPAAAPEGPAVTPDGPAEAASHPSSATAEAENESMRGYDDRSGARGRPPRPRPAR